MKKIIAIMMLMLFLVACGKDDTVDTADEVKFECPSSCNDKNACTKDYCSEDTNYECRYKAITPCCGNDVCEEDEDYKECPSDCKAPQMPDAIANLIAKTSKIDSYSYEYYYQTKSTKVFVKEDKVKHELPVENFRNMDETKDTVYFDLKENKAWLYCTNAGRCTVDEILYETDFDKYWLETPIERLNKIKTAKVAGEETIDNRKALIIEFTNDDGNLEKMGIDSYYGIPHFSRIYDGDKEIKLDYDNLGINSVSDSDVAFPIDARFE